MIELEELKKLIVVGRCGTLSKAAEELHISQPSISRSMQKIEEELDTKLFIRSKNKMILNDIGEYTIIEAQKVIDASNHMQQNIQNYIKRMHTLNIGSCAPAPLWHIIPTALDRYPQTHISSEMNNQQELIQGLQQDQYHLIVLSHPLKEENIISIKYDEEFLMVSFPPTDPHSLQESVTFEELDGMNFLSFSKIGAWSEIHDKMLPHSKFFSQQERDTYNELIQASTLPSFITDLSMEHYGKPENRIIVPISSKEAHLTFYLVYKKENQKKLEQLISNL